MFSSSSKMCLCILFTLLLFVTQEVEKVPLEDVSSAYLYILDPQHFCRYRRIALFSDKPVYKNGETLHVSAYFYDLITKQPLANCQSNLDVSLSLYDSKDSYVATLSQDKNPTPTSDLSTVNFSYEVGAALPGGVYSIRYDDGTIKDEISIFVLKFSNRAFAIVGDWNSDTISPGFLLKGKLTVRALTTEVTNIENGVIRYSFSDENGKELVSNEQPLVGNSFQINFQVPELPGRLLTLSVEVSSDTYQTLYKKDFYTALHDEVVIDFTLARGKVVPDFPNKFYFQTFADKDRIDTYAFASASLIVETSGVANVVQSVTSNDEGRGSFSLIITKQNILDQAKILLRVIFSPTETRDFSVISLADTQISPVLLDLQKLVYRTSDFIQINLSSNEYLEKVHIVLQDKTQVIYKSSTSVGSLSSSGSKSRTINIQLLKLGAFAGGVYTLQVFGPESPVTELPPIPVRPPGPIPVDIAIPANGAAVNAPPLIEPVLAQPPDVIDVVPPFHPPVPDQNPLVDYQGQILQEADIFIKPTSIIGASVSLDKTYYLPGEEVSGRINLRKYCPGCDLDPNSSNVRAFIIITDESAFLEIEKSRENPSLFTKVFLQKEVWSPTSQFKNSHRYIEYLFNSSANLSSDEIQAADTRLELLLGNQGKRKFLFDPDYLQKFVNSPYDAQYDEVRNFFNYLVPKTQERVFFQPFFFNARPVNANEAVPPMPPMPMPAPAPEPVAPPTPTPSPSPPTPPVDTTGEPTIDEIQNALRKDTILYQRLSNFSNDEIRFNVKLPNPVTNFSVRVFLYNNNGKYGYAENSVKVRKPINIVIDEPLYIYNDESFVVPVLIENNQAQDATIKFTSPIQATLIISRGKSATRNITFKNGDIPVTILITDSKGTELARHVLRPSVIRAGIRKLSGTSGYVSTKRGSNSSLVYTDAFPVQLIKGGNSLSVCYQNNVISLILDVIETFNRIPTGCFEQASVTTFPLIIAIRILKLLPQTAEVAQLLRELIDKLRKGIDLLLTYEAPSGGFEWFGEDPGHVTLTAYGLWQFSLIQKLNEPALSFDTALIQRSENFINSKKNNQGGFELRAGYDELGNPEQSVSDIFVVFVLSGALTNFDTLFEPEYNYIKNLYVQFKAGQRTLDSYKLALIGLLFFNKNEIALATEIASILASRQDVATGEILQGVTTITRSVGLSLSIETTSLTMLLILRLKDTTHNLVLERALKFILSNLKGGYFLSTQATVLSLLAISEYLEAHTQSSVSIVTFDVQVNSLLSQSLIINTANSFESKCLDLSSLLPQVEGSSQSLRFVVKPNSNSLFAADNQYLFAISLETYSYLPNSTANSPLDATISLSRSTKTNIYSITLTNKETKEQGMTVCEFNKPSCFDFNINDLESLRERHFIDYYEIREANSKIVFYWRGLAPSVRKAFSLTLSKRFALNNCIERAHEIYLYYGRDVSVIYKRA